MNYIRSEAPQESVVESTPSQEEKIASHVSSPVLPELERMAVAQVLGLETESDRKINADKIETLLEFAKINASGDSLEDIKWAIRDLELSLGTTPFGENKINYLTRYAFLRMEKDKINSELKKFNPYGKDSE